MSDQKPVDQTPVVEPASPEQAAPATDKPVEQSTAENSNMEAENTTEAPSEQAKAEEPAAATTAPPAEVPKPEDQKPEQPAYLTNVPSLSEFFNRLPGIVSKVGHSEMWGVPLKTSEDIPTVNVLIKFLRANEGNIDAAEDQLRKALEWRRDIKPLELIESGRYSASKYGGLGYLTTYEQDGQPLVFTWNIYGAVKDVQSTFGDCDEFIKWRAALMEMAVQELKMKDATTVIDYDGEKDPYQMIQVHDYLNVKFFRMDPSVRAASKKTIEVFATAYPELLREKFFVNVPAVMGWLFGAMKLILSRNTTKKFHPIANGANLAREFPAAVSEKIPKAYGGKGPELKDEARTVPLVEDKDDKKDEDKPAGAETEKQDTPQETPVKTEESVKEDTK